MPDEIDFSTEQYADWLENRLENIRREAAEKQLLPNGRCYNCGEEVAPEAKFCDDSCVADYKYREAIEAKRRMNHAQVQ